MFFTVCTKFITYYSPTINNICLRFHLFRTKKSFKIFAFNSKLPKKEKKGKNGNKDKMTLEQRKASYHKHPIYLPPS